MPGPIWDFEDGDFIMDMGEDMGMDSDGNMMIKMDTTTAVLMAITNWDPTTFVDLSKISNDIESIERKQGTMSESGIKKYAEQYTMASKKYKFGFGTDTGAADIIDWSFDYTVSSQNSVIENYAGERALINHDMAITVPYDMKWANKKSLIGQGRTFVFMSKDGNDFQKPTGADVFFEIGDPIQLAQSEPLDLAYPQNKATLDKLIMVEFNSISVNPIGISDESGMPMMGLSFKEPTELKADSDWVISYTSCQGDDSPKLIFAIINGVNMYIGKLWTKSETNPAEIERMGASWLSSLVYCEDSEKNREPGEWVEPVYKSNHTVTIDSEICVTVPDNFVSNIDAKVDMSDRFCFVAVPSGYEDGLINYKNASIGIGMVNKQNVGGLNSLWNSASPEDVAERIHGMLASNGLENIEDVVVKKNFMKSFAFHSEQEFDDGYYCAYAYFIFVGEHMYNGSFYFNVRKTHSEYEKIVREWLSGINLA